MNADGWGVGFFSGARPGRAAEPPAHRRPADPGHPLGRHAERPARRRRRGRRERALRRRPALGRRTRVPPRRGFGRRRDRDRSGEMMMPAENRVQAQPPRYLDALRADVRAGLTATPKTLPPKYFYDARGSELFDEITRLPEYYLTRAETAILERHAGEIASQSRRESLVELGSGTSAKTRRPR